MSLPDRPCSEAEIEAQIAYLSATPVSGLADALRVRRLRMRQGVVRSLRALGNLKTEFGELGPLIPSPMEGEPKFRIHEVVPTLRANPTADPDLLRCIEQFIEKDRRGAVVYNVTILRSVADRIIKDGNKRTLAFFERRRGLNDPIYFPVFVLEEATPGT